MAYPRTTSSLSVGLLLAAAVLQPPFSDIHGQNTPSLQGVSHDEADVAACKENLNRIFEALEKYQAKHKRLPDWLSDLLSPDVITDPKVFMCPYVDRLGDLASWRAGILSEVFKDPRLLTSYSYEFCAKEVPLVPGSNPTHQEYKLRQMKLAGDRVPVVRCFAHEPILNVSIGGRFYTSGRYWENEFTNLVSHEELSPRRLFQDRLAEFLKKPRTYPSRSGDASPRLLDLTEKYNFGLNETFNPSGGEGDFAKLPQGVVALDRVGVTYDIRGRIQLRPRKPRLPFPERVDGIKVGQTFKRAHFLCGSAGTTNSVGTAIGRFDVWYADGGSNRIQILYGKHVQDWWFDPLKPQPEEAQIAWQGSSQLSQSQSRKQMVRIYNLTWANPRPEAPIATLDFVSALTDSAPFLIAITLE